MAKRKKDGSLPETAGKRTAYEQSGFPTAECIRAEAAVGKILREQVKDTGLKARQVLEALLPGFPRGQKITIDANVVRAGVRKILDTE